MSDKSKLTALAGIQIAAGVALFFAPFALGFSNDEPALWSACFAAAGILLFASLVSVGEATWSGRGRLTLGLWAVTAPAVLGFLGDVGAAWSHMLIGAVTAVGAVVVLTINAGSASTIRSQDAAVARANYIGAVSRNVQKLAEPSSSTMRRFWDIRVVLDREPLTDHGPAALSERHDDRCPRLYPSGCQLCVLIAVVLLARELLRTRHSPCTSRGDREVAICPSQGKLLA